MQYQSFGFIGGGRITRIILTALKNAGRLPEKTVVSDANADVLAHLQKDFPSISAGNDNTKPASCDLVFLSLHPPVLPEVLGAVKSSLRPGSVVVSLAPKLTIGKLSVILGHGRIVRMIPNAPTVINKGFNPASFSKDLSADEKGAITNLFNTLGKSPEVPEDSLEAYAIIAAMGPTYFWFQWQALLELGKSFGLAESAAKEAVSAMLSGAAQTMFASSLTPAEVMDLVPVKPLAEDENTIRDMYRTRLSALFNKLRS